MNCVLFTKMDKVFSFKKKTLKTIGKRKKYWKSQRILSIGNMGTMLKC